MWSNEIVLIVIEDLQRVRVFEMCIVQITKNAIKT
jgi:hypothetical protein